VTLKVKEKILRVLATESRLVQKAAGLPHWLFHGQFGKFGHFLTALAMKKRI